MNQFDYLVREQLKVMEELLILQSEIEKYQQAGNFHNDDKQVNLIEKKESLKKAHEQFDNLTEEVIKHFQSHLTLTSAQKIE